MSTSLAEPSLPSLSTQLPARVHLVVVGPTTNEYRPRAALDELLDKYPEFSNAERTSYGCGIAAKDINANSRQSISGLNEYEAPKYLPQWAARLECCVIPIEALSGSVSNALQLGLEIIHSIPATMVCVTDHNDHRTEMNMQSLADIVPYQPFILITNQILPGLPDIHTINTQNEAEKEKLRNLKATSNMPFRIHPYPASYDTYVSHALSTKINSRCTSLTSSYYQVFDGERIDSMHAFHCSLIGYRLEAVHRLTQHESSPFFEFIGNDGQHTNATCKPTNLDRIMSASICEPPLMPFLSITPIVREYMYRYFHYHFSKYFVDTGAVFFSQELDYFRSCIDLAAQNVLFDRYIYTYNRDPQRDPVLAEANISVNVEKDEINPYRCAFGSIHSPSHQMISKAKEVLRLRNVFVSDDSNFILSGLAYDIPKDILKVYYITRLRHVPEHLFEAIDQETKDNGLRDFAVISWSYRLQSGGPPFEEKLYTYSSGAQEVVVMRSNKRGVLHQHDCFFSDDELEKQSYSDGTPRIWYDKCNVNGQKILDELCTLKIFPDAIEYVNVDRFSFYIPLWC